MAIIKFKSKVQVIVNVVSLNEDYVVLEIEDETRNSLAIDVKGRYIEHSTGDFIKAFSFPVLNSLANQLGQVPIPSGASLIETRNIQLVAGVMTIFDQYKDFGLNSSDWQLIIE